MSAANSAGTSLNQPGLLMLEKLHIYHEELCIERGGWRLPGRYRRLRMPI